MYPVDLLKVGLNFFRSLPFRGVVFPPIECMN